MLKRSCHAAHAWQLSLAECAPREREGDWPWCQSHIGQGGHEAPKPAAPQLPVPSLLNKTKGTYSELRQGCRQQEPVWWHWPQPGSLAAVCRATPSPVHTARAPVGSTACCGRPQGKQGLWAWCTTQTPRTGTHPPFFQAEPRLLLFLIPAAHDTGSQSPPAQRAMGSAALCSNTSRTAQILCSVFK